MYAVWRRAGASPGNVVSVDTLVSTEDGLRPVEEIKAGDYIWAEDTETGGKELKQITDVIVTMTDQLV